MTVLGWAAGRWPDRPLVVGGDSAGGGLAAGAALRARDEGDAYARRLADAGVPVRPLPGPGLVHGYFGLTEIASAAAARREEVLAALRDLLSAGEG